VETIKALIVSDGKPGHFNQSIALCRYKNWNYEIVTVKYKSKFSKLCSYILDKLGIYSELLFASDIKPVNISVVVSTGSTTYYPAKTFAINLHAKNIAIMLPKGYRYDFDYILAQAHDNPPNQKNIIKLPINLVLTTPEYNQEEMTKRFIFDNSKKYIGVIIGGPNSIFSISIEDLKPLFEYLFSLDSVNIVVTTSRRTPKEIEEWLASLPLSYLLRYSLDTFNPIPAFLQNCQNIVITSDSTSMISEAVSYGKSNIDILMLKSKKSSKFHTLIKNLEAAQALHVFNGNLSQKNSKVLFEKYLEEIKF